MTESNCFLASVGPVVLPDLLGCRQKTAFSLLGHYECRKSYPDIHSLKGSDMVYRHPSLQYGLPFLFVLHVQSDSGLIFVCPVFS